ncbi:MAG: hypothetical protein NTY47_05315 [Candidatus Omnitrophica bacterium]|nr:hypothetical protein [Candidatus Omnitrophota bacterium]
MKKRFVFAILLFCVVLVIGCQSTRCNTNCTETKPIDNPWDALMAADGWIQRNLW